MRGGGLGGGAALRLARPTVSGEIRFLIRVADPDTVRLIEGFLF